jgi:hypothetical protein
MQTNNEIIELVFSQPPKAPCTFNVVLSDKAREENVTPFQMLWNLLINGAKRAFGENITVQDITDAQFELLKRYMNSIGYELKSNYTYGDDNITPISVNIWFELYIPPNKCR